MILKFKKEIDSLGKKSKTKIKLKLKNWRICGDLNKNVPIVS